jgi:hypothetical protein
LSSVYNVATPASCVFSSGTPTVTTPASGGTFYIPLSTTSGCQWSATSQSPWISVQSNSLSGNNSATVSIDVQPLPSGTTLPRDGRVLIGNAANGQIITIVENATCTYSLSPDPSVGIGFTPSGGANTVQVTTQSGCAWSASSSQNWLTIQNGSGTGSGSFTITAAPNAPSSQDPAMIDVMGQILPISEFGQMGSHCMHYPGCFGNGTGGVPPAY